MSVADAIKFREFVKSNPAIEAQMRETIHREGSVDNVALGLKHGFNFTAAEAEAAWSEISGADDLTDFELEMVAAGGRSPTNTEGSTSNNLGSSNQPG